MHICADEMAVLAAAVPTLFVFGRWLKIHAARLLA
jgi:hypothetical protein